MKLEYIKKMWAEDAVIDPLEMNNATLGTAKLHNKYMNIVADERLKYHQLSDKKNNVYKKLHDYYIGRADPSVYKEKGALDIKLLKNELPIYIDTDEEYQEIKFRVAVQEEKLKYLDSIINSLKNRHWEIKNFIDWQRFSHGER